MAYIGFDLDETLGRFASVHAHVLFLTPGPVYQNLLKGYEPFAPSHELQGKMKLALNEFAKCLLANDSEIGLLRPGILRILGRLAELKESDKVKAISIYSNNGNLGLLLLASSMIETALGKPGLFCNHIDWYNPIRRDEITPGRPGAGFKTGAVLRKSFMDPRCDSVTSENAINMNDMYFFDDIIHPDVLAKVGPKHYFRVNPYKREPASLEAIDSCLDAALKSVGLDKDEKYLEYVAPIAAAMGVPQKQNQEILDTYKNIFESLTKFNRSYTPELSEFQDDTDTLMSTIESNFSSDPSVNYGSNYFPVTDGGRRKRKVLRRKTIKKRTKKLRKRHTRARKN
jgi:hypothetical protein